MVAGEWVRRLASRCLVDAQQDEIRSALGARNLGDAHSAGAETMILLARAWFGRNANKAGKVALRVDAENAHNSIHRAPCLNGAREHLPGMSPWVEWCYTAPSLLRYGGHLITAESGLQQGEACASPLWSVGALQLAEGARQAVRDAGYSLDLDVAFRDDCLVAGDWEAVAVWWAHITQHGPAST